VNAAELLIHLRARSVRVWAEGDRLRYRGPQEEVGAELLAELARRKADLLALLRTTTAAGSPAVRPVPREGEIPLSFHQQQLWLLAQMRPAGSEYNEPVCLRLTGLLDSDALVRALAGIVARHEVLRTGFPDRGGRPLQEIHPGVELPLPRIDLSALGAPHRQAESDRLAVEAARWPFDLARPPLLRTLLLRLGSREHLLVLVMHHIVHDGESLQVFAGELAALYTAGVRKEPSPLPPLALQYADFAVWQRQSLQGETLAAELEHWRGRLAGSEPVLDLPLDRPRPRERSQRGGRVPFFWPAEEVVPLRALGRAAGGTLFMTLLAGFFALLHRISGQDRVNLGLPRSGRDQMEIERLIGFIVNTQVLTADLSEGPDVRQLLRGVREEALAAQSHPLLPFEILVRELVPERLPGVHPLFQVMLTYQQDPRRALALPGLELTFVDVFTGTAKFDLDLYLADAGGAVEGYLDYAADVFEEATARRLLGGFRRLLAGMAAAPAQTVATLPLLDPAERSQILVEWDARGRERRDRCLHELFEEQVELGPEQPALVSETGTLAYRELNERANRLAHHLLAIGVLPGERVAVAGEGEADGVAALLAVLKAGGTFVFLDPRWPAARSVQVLQEIEPPVLLAGGGSLAGWEEVAGKARGGGAPIRVVDLERIDPWTPATSPGVRVDPEAPAYIAYTSGSTGQPRGVVQSHASFRQFLGWQSRCFGIRAGQRFAQWATITYDAAYCEVLGALCFGATLCAAPPAVRHDPAACIDWLRRKRVTLLQVVPSFLRQLLRALPATAAGALADLETILLAGEVLPVDLAREVLERFGGRVRLFNLYGPTETVLATWYEVGEEALRRPSIPVGRAIDGRQILILDAAGQLCPVGIRGEICVRSPHLTLGYFRRPEETARVFVPNPLDDGSPDLVYRTGDLGHWLPDGTVELFGRADHQVKIRGMRVEPGEIEAVLARQPGVREGAVVAHDFGDNDRRLVAFVAAAAEVTPAALREALRAVLPEHMVPAAFVRLEALPRTATGKLDRRALPVPELRREDAGAPFEAPRTSTEEQVAACWREVLRLDRVGVHDDFFSLGGHSLLAIQAVHLIAQTCGVALPLRSLFDGPTVAALAARVEETRSAGLDREGLRSLLAEVRGLSDEELEALLESAEEMEMQGADPYA
jgi:aspartate racemase